MFAKKPAHKYKHLYSKGDGRFGWFARFTPASKIMFVLILILVVAVVWLGGATAKWKVQKKNYRARINLLRAENEALRVEKDLMITRMTIAGLLKPVKDGVYEFEGENIYDNNGDDEDDWYTETLSFTEFSGTYKNDQLKINFKINNILEDSPDKIEGRIFIVLGDDDLPANELLLMPNDSQINADRKPDGTKGGASFSIREFKDMSFSGAIKAANKDKYESGLIYVFNKEGELIQLRRLDLDLSNADHIVTE